VREVDENTRAALTGSRSGDELVCWVWYDGALAYPRKLPVDSWSMDWDGGEGEKVPGTIKLQIADPDGELGPWLYEDPLWVGGSQVQVSYLVGGAAEIKIGWYRVTDNESSESWSFRIIREDGWVEPDSPLPAHQRVLALPAGSTVSVTAQDLTEALDADEFLAPEQPPGTSTVMAEIERLVGDTMPVVFEGLDDVALPRGTTWEDNRMEAIQDLLSMLGGSFRMGPDGELVCYRKASSPVFVCAGGDEGVFIRMSRKQSLQGVANVGVVTSTQKITGKDGAEVDVPIVGSYEVESGPLRVGGPMGRRVVKMANPLMDSPSKAAQAAKTLVLNQLTSQTVDLDVWCLPDPTVEIGDYGTIATPVIDGRMAHLNGEVLSISLSGGGGGVVSEMKLTVRCLLSHAAAALKGISLAPYLTGTRPELTYDNVNPFRTIDDMQGLTNGDYGAY
jgi:hypothetical protein